MNKITKLLSLLTLTALLGLPSFAAIEAQATAVRSQVIGESLSLAYAEEKGEAQSVMVYIEDIDQAAVRSRVSTSEPTARTLSSAPEEYPNQHEIEAKQAEIMALRNASKEAYLKQNTAFAEKYLDGKVEYISKYSPVIIASLDSVDTNRLALNSGVESIELYEVEIAVEDDSSTSAPMTTSTTTDGTEYLDLIGATDVHPYYDGSGIKVGVLENGLPEQSYWPSIGLNSARCFSFGQPAQEIGHASQVAYTMKSVAPGAQLYAAQAYFKHPSDETKNKFDYIQPIEWMLYYGVNVITISIAIDNGLRETYSPAAQWIDSIAWAYGVTVTIAAGNYDEQNEVLGVPGMSMASNAITVGAVYSNGRLLDQSLYNDFNTTDISKPDMCSIGDGVNIGFGNTSGGTSIATPQVAGAVALMCQQEPDIMGYPEVIKALLSANVNNDISTYKSKASTTVPINNTNLFRKYGAGILDCENVYTALNADRYYAGSFDENSQNERHVRSVKLEAGKTARFALCYLRRSYYSSVNGTVTSYAPPSINISIKKDGQYLVTSLNLAGNMKIIKFEPSVEGTYTVELDCNTNIDYTAWYSFAWCQY